MNAELISALASLAWPLLVAVLLIVLLPTLLPVIINTIRSRSFKIKYGPMEVTVQDVSDQLRRQVEDLQDEMRKLRAQVTPEQKAPKDVKLQPSLEKGGERYRSILWVDDHPEKHAHEIAKLQEEDYEVFTAESTNAALTLLKKKISKPSLVITDMRRREGLTYNRTAGLDLIRAIKSGESNVPNIPIYVYDSVTVVKRRSKQVQEAGGNGITASPIQLFEFIDQNFA